MKFNPLENLEPRFLSAREDEKDISDKSSIYSFITAVSTAVYGNNIKSVSSQILNDRFSIFKKCLNRLTIYSYVGSDKYDRIEFVEVEDLKGRIAVLHLHSSYIIEYDKLNFLFCFEPAAREANVGYGQDENQIINYWECFLKKQFQKRIWYSSESNITYEFEDYNNALVIFFDRTPMIECYVHNTWDYNSYFEYDIKIIGDKHIKLDPYIKREIGAFAQYKQGMFEGTSVSLKAYGKIFDKASTLDDFFLDFLMTCPSDQTTVEKTSLL